MKTILSQPIGGDGANATLSVDGGNLVAGVSYPIAKLVTPINDVIDAAIDKVEAAIPGDWDKAVLEPIREAAKAELVALLGE